MSYMLPLQAASIAKGQQKMKKQHWQQAASWPVSPQKWNVGCFLILASGRPSRSTGHGGTGIVSGAPGGSPGGTVTSSGRPSVSVTRKTEPGPRPGGTLTVTVSGAVTDATPTPGWLTTGGGGGIIGGGGAAATGKWI